MNKHKEIKYSEYQEHTRKHMCPCCGEDIQSQSNGFFCLKCSRAGCWASYSVFMSERQNVLIFVHCGGLK